MSALTQRTKQASVPIMLENLEANYRQVRAMDYHVNQMDQYLSVKDRKLVAKHLGISVYSQDFLSLSKQLLVKLGLGMLPLAKIKKDFADYTKNIKIPDSVKHYEDVVKASLQPVAGTTEIRRTGAIATIDDVLNDPLEPLVWKSYICSLPIIVKNDPSYNFKRIIIELNLLSSLDTACVNSPEFQAPAAVTQVSPTELLSNNPSVDLSHNYLLYNPVTLIPFILAPFACDTQNHLEQIEHLLVTILLHEARHIFRGDLLNNHGYDPSSPKHNKALTAMFDRNPSKTCYGFPFNSSGSLDNILADININMSLEADLGPQVAFGGSDLAKSLIVHGASPIVKDSLDALNQTLTTEPSLQQEAAQLTSDPRYRQPEKYFYDTDVLLLKQKLLWCKTYQADAKNSPKMNNKAQAPTNANHKQNGQKPNQNQGAGSGFGGSSLKNGQQGTGTSASKRIGNQPNQGNQQSLSNGDIIDINQKKITNMKKNGSAKDKASVDKAQRKNVALAQEAERQAKIEFPDIKFSKIGGRLREIKNDFEKARPLPTFAFKMRSINHSFMYTSKIEWQRRHFVYPNRLDIAHITKAKRPAADIIAYLDVSGSIDIDVLKKMLSVLKATVEGDQKLTVRLFADSLGIPVEFKNASRTDFQRDFKKLMASRNSIDDFGTDLIPVFDDIIDTPKSIHVLISDFCCMPTDFTTRRDRLGASPIVFVNTYDKKDTNRYDNILPLLERYRLNHQKNTQILYLPNYTL